MHIDTCQMIRLLQMYVVFVMMKSNKKFFSDYYKNNKNKTHVQTKKLKVALKLFQSLF